jgi:hypothetical protein
VLRDRVHVRARWQLLESLLELAHDVGRAEELAAQGLELDADVGRADRRVRLERILEEEAGVTIGFDDNAGSGMRIGSSEPRRGLLVAVGTEAAPIVFTSANDSKKPGDWTNLEFHASPVSGNQISHARVEYAGAASGTRGFGCGPLDNDAAIIVMGLGPDGKGPAGPFIDHTSFEHIAGTTVIVSGWVDDAGPSLVDTNTFGTDVPGCHVSRPRRTGAGDVCDGGRTTCW